MVDVDGIAFNIAAFIGGLFILEFGADKFVDHTAKVAQRLRIPATLIALLTAGAEWEELAVVVASISQSQSPLALGNILGSSISNILGAFSLGLIFSSTSSITFDRSSKIYTSVLLSLTTFFSLFILFFQPMGRLGGAVLIGMFVVYISSIAWAIYRGIVAPPEDSDSDSDSDSSDSASESDSDDEESHIRLKSQKSASTTLLLPPTRPGSSASNATTLNNHEGSPQLSPSDADAPAHQELITELAPEIFEDAESQRLTRPEFDAISLSSTPLNIITARSQPHSTLYHLAHLFLGLLALSLSGYILSHTLSTLSSLLSLSSTILGTTLLSLATTLPEKLISILSSRRGEHGIVIANTAGSNIFLVTLCAGVLYCAGDLVQLAGSASLFEVASMWISSLVLFVIVMTGGKKWMGWVLLVAYIAFIAMEFTVDRR